MPGFELKLKDPSLAQAWLPCLTPLQSVFVRHSPVNGEDSTVKNLFSVRKVMGESVFRMGGISSAPQLQPIGESEHAPVGNRRPMPSKLVDSQEWGVVLPISVNIMKNTQLQSIAAQLYNVKDSYYVAQQKLAEMMFVQAALGNKSFNMGNKMNASTVARDGAVQFSDNHIGVLETTMIQSNRFSNGLTAAGVGAVRGAMSNFLDEDGEPMGIQPDTLVICNDAQSLEAATAIVGTNFNPDAVQRRFNYLHGSMNIIVLRYAGNFLRQLGWSGPLPYFMLDSSLMNGAPASVMVDFEESYVETMWDALGRQYMFIAHATFNAAFNIWQYAAAGNCPGGTKLDEPILIPVPTVNAGSDTDAPDDEGGGVVQP